MQKHLGLLTSNAFWCIRSSSSLTSPKERQTLKRSLNLRREKSRLFAFSDWVKNSFLIGAAFQKQTLPGLVSTFYSQQEILFIISRKVKHFTKGKHSSRNESTTSHLYPHPYAIASQFSYLSLYVTFKLSYFGPTTLVNPRQAKIPNKPLLMCPKLIISFFLSVQ